MQQNASFDYAVLRVVPRVDRGEFINAAVVVYCRERRYLDVRVRLDEGRLKALWPEVDVALVWEHLRALERICRGEAGAGPIAGLSESERFHWLTAPRSTILQPSPVHTGVCGECEGLLERLAERLLG
jgi:hypothetical protein